ncbi:hypothetical protein [Acidisphaera rubrifaciens]|uniref:Uncharacterized protein n=1 Tax=Acidisphaera rubrifaciens HS-AP3 TaxID=1231350 RepID=A0A0D6P908_9PROT|nr:hypothetical protein Asru_0414_05 [Acidisphaera rubrifaciens HS-AP3]
MKPIRRAAMATAALAAAAAFAAGPALAADTSAAPSPSGAVTSTKTPTHNGVASPGPQNPGGRMPESGHIPGAPGQNGSHAGSSLKSPGENAH